MIEATVTDLATEKSVLVIGADGTIGRRLASSLEVLGGSVWRSTRRRAQGGARSLIIDLEEDPSEIILPADPIRAAILCAASTSMERCRSEPSKTRRINVENTVALAKRLVDVGIFTVFVSSNTVFDGQTAFPKATDRTNPQSEYGRQKAEAEERLLCLGDRIAVVRFSKIIPPDMPLLTGWMNDLAAGKIIRPFSDGVMAPVSISFAVELLTRILTYRSSGITQVSANDDITYEYAAKYIAEKVGANVKQVQPTSCLQAENSVFPSHTTLDTSKLSELGFEAPPPTHALDQLISACDSIAQCTKVPAA